MQNPRKKKMAKKNMEEYIKFMYEKAIEGRNVHYQNYNAWMNMYAIIVGALFVGFYTAKDNIYLSLFISIVGLVAAICWRYSVQGYYSWMKSWIKIVQEYEKKLNETTGRSLYVYNVYLAEKDEKERHYSTQKITLAFISFVIIAWILVLVCKIFTSFSVFLCFFHWHGIFCLRIFSVIVLIIVVVVYCCILKKTFFSNRKGMKKSIEGGEEWEE